MLKMYNKKIKFFRKENKVVFCKKNYIWDKIELFFKKYVIGCNWIYKIKYNYDRLVEWCLYVY